MTRGVHSVTVVAAVVEVGVVLHFTVAVVVIRTVLAGDRVAGGGMTDGIRNEIDFTLGCSRRASLRRGSRLMVLPTSVHLPVHVLEGIWRRGASESWLVGRGRHMD